MEPVNHSNFTATQRKSLIYNNNTNFPTTKLEKLHQGDILVLELKPENAEWYSLPYVLAEIEKDVSHIDTTDPDAEFQVQILCPVNLRCADPLEKK